MKPKFAYKKTPQQVRNDLFQQGISVAAYCRSKNIDYQVARDLLGGKLKGTHGKAHKVAVGLGLK